MPRASAPNTPTRSASWGVNRYGSWAFGSGGRKRLDWARRSWKALAKEAHPGSRERGRVADEERAAEREHGGGEQQVEAQGREQSVEDRVLRGDVLAEHEVQRVPADRHQHRQDEHREDRRVEPITTGRLAVASRPVA